MTLMLLQRFSSCPKKDELKLENNPNLKRYICNGCKEYGNNGMRYRCEDCNCSVHKDCMFSKLATTTRSSKTSFSNSTSNHPFQNSTAKEPRDIVMLVGNMSKVSSAIALKRTWICTLVVSTSRKNSKLAMWNFTFVRLSQCGNFAIELNCQKLRCGRMFLSVVSIIFMFLA